MTTFQLITLPLLGLLIVVTAVAIGRSRVVPRIGVAWIALWLAAAGTIAFPDILVALAQILGIGRGADLVLYVFILAGFVAFFVTYLRFRRIEEQLTVIVRHLAIHDAERPEESDTEGASRR